MKKNIWRFAFLTAAVLSGGWLAFYGAILFLARQYAQTDAASIGVIGGADGPTAIFVASSGPDWDLYITVAVLVIGIIGFIRLRKPKDKE